MMLLPLVLLVVVAIIASLFLAPTFGARPSGESLDRIARSGQCSDGAFANSVETVINTRQPGDSMDLSGYLFPSKGKNPIAPLPSVAFDKARFNSGDFVWFGHSTSMFRNEQLIVLTDPVVHRASPVPLGGNPFAMQVAPGIESLPAIDVVVISHDPYDHLDHRGNGALAWRVKRFLVPPGIRDHLRRWRIPDVNTTELDGYETHRAANTDFTLTVARHFSGRGITVGAIVSPLIDAGIADASATRILSRPRTRSCESSTASVSSSVPILAVPTG